MILIRISSTYRPSLTADELYDATRWSWLVGKRREKARYAIPVYEGVALKVYEIHRWVPGGSTFYKTDVHPGLHPQERWEFVGAPAPIEVRRKYVKGSVESYFSTGVEIQFAMSTARRIASTPNNSLQRTPDSVGFTLVTSLKFGQND